MADTPAGTAARVMISGRETGGRLGMVRVEARAGNSPPRHRHHWEDEVVCVLAGEITIERDEERFEAGAGSVTLLPRGGEHAYRVDSPVAVLLIAFAPAGLEVAVADGIWEERSLERLVSELARYGVEITGPPLEG